MLGQDHALLKKPPKCIVRLLETYHPLVTSLGEYLNLTGHGEDGEILTRTMVGLDTWDKSAEKQSQVKPTKSDHKRVDRETLEKDSELITMAQTIESAQTILLWRSTRHSTKHTPAKQNVLTLGCRMSNEAYPELAVPVITGPYANGLVSKHMMYENTTNKFMCQSYFFADLLQRIGPRRMIDLLTDTAIYFPADNGCYFQICGQPVFEIPILPAPNKPRKGLPLTEIVLAKNTLMYTKATRSKAGAIRLGFSPNHVLNRIHDLVDSFPGDYFKAIYLAKHIFPSQFGLPSFKPENSEQAILGLGKVKTPRRLKTLVQPTGLMSKLAVKSKAQGFKPILDRCCPSKFIAQHFTEVERLSLVEMIEPSPSYIFDPQNRLGPSDFDHQKSVTFACTPQPSKPPSPKFAQFVCSHYEVQKFIWSMIQAYGLGNWWGGDSKHNESIIRNNVSRIVRLRRFEKVSLHEMVQGLKSKECSQWLSKHPSGPKSEQMLHDFVWWFYVSFVGGLIQNTFFVTESAIFKNRTLYFRLDDWEQLCYPLMDHLKTNLFRKVDGSELGSAVSQLGHSFLRLLPKDHGVRPIVNLKRKRSLNSGVSNNSVLLNLFSVLTYERDISPTRMGASVLGLNHVYTRFKEFKARLGPCLPRLFFVKVDIHACFDNIQQEKILQVISDLLSEDQYVIQRYVTTTLALTSGRNLKQFKRQAYPSDEAPEFEELVSKMAKTLKNVIFGDQVKYAYADKEDLLNLLKEHITQNYVKIGAQTYQQKVGIPQGSIVSPLLCSLFFADMDRCRLGFTNTSTSLLLRLIDDFLYVTTSQEDAERFLKVMAEGSEEYGCFLSIEKTLTNFDFQDVNTLVGDDFPWCGNLINTKTLEFKADISRYHAIHIADTFTVDTTKSPGQVFRQKMFQMVKMRLNIIYLDTNLNSPPTVLLNIYQAFRLIAAKYVAYLNAWGANTINGWKFCYDVVDQLIRFVCTSTQRQAHQIYVKDLGGRCGIKASEIMWLGKHGFKTALGRRPQKFRLIIQRIEADLACQRRGTIDRKSEAYLRSVMRSRANEALKALKY